MADTQVQDDPYSPSGTDQDTQTRTLSEVMRIAIDQWVRNNLYVNLPGKVIKVRDNKTVDVQVEIQEIFKVQGLITLPPLLNVPVEHPSGVNWSIKLPVQVGDTGKVCFFDRSLDNWLTNGGIVDPQDTRMHNLSDCSFVPGLSPVTVKIAGNATDMILTNGKTTVTIQKDGQIQLGGNAEPAVLGQTLVSGLTDLTTALSNLQTAMTNLNSATTAFATAIGTGPIGLISSPVPGSPVPTGPSVIAAASAYNTALSSYATALTAFSTAISMFKTKYLTTSSTNILSQQTFAQRGSSG